MKIHLFPLKKILLLLVMSPAYLFCQEETKMIDLIYETKSDLKVSNDELKKLQDDNKSLKIITDKLITTNDSIILVIKNQNKESLSSQKKLFDTNFEIINNTLSDIQNIEKQIRNYRTLLAVAHSGTLITNLNSPTNSELGISFADILKENSKNILSKDLTGKSKSNFILTIERITKIPVISSVFNTNPITSLISSVFQQAIGYDQNKISNDAISKFNESLQPYIDFYDKIGMETDVFKNSIVAYKFELLLTETKLNEFKYKIYSILKTNDAMVNADLYKYFRKNNDQTLSLDDYKLINNFPEIQETLKFINKTPVIIINQEPFKNSNKIYINNIVELLKSANTNNKIKFNNTKIESFIKALEGIEKEIK